MRIGVVPEGLRERIVVRSHRFPLPIFDVMGTMLLSRAVMAGVRLGVFDRLRAEPKSAAALAQETGCNPHGIELLLDALVTCGYLEQHHGGYANAPLATRWLLSDTEPTLANFVLYNYDQWEWTSHLEEFLEHGEARDIHQKLDDAQWRRYLLGLRDLATLSADELVARLPFRAPPRRVLDIGGGHAHYCIALCRRHADLRATIVDLEPATRVGREQVERAGLSHRIDFRAGELPTAALGRDHDAAFLFNVVHHLDEKTNREALRQVLAALVPGGLLAVWESFREERERQSRDQLGALLALFFGITSARRTYTFGEVTKWARAAGFHRVRRRKLRSAPYSSLLLANKAE